MTGVQRTLTHDPEEDKSWGAWRAQTESEGLWRPSSERWGLPEQVHSAMLGRDRIGSAELRGKEPGEGTAYAERSVSSERGPGALET